MKKCHWLPDTKKFGHIGVFYGVQHEWWCIHNPKHHKFLKNNWKTWLGITTSIILAIIISYNS